MTREKYDKLVTENLRLQRENSRLREQLSRSRPPAGSATSPAYTYTDGMGWSHDVPEGYHDMGR